MTVKFMMKSKDPWANVYMYRNCKHHVGSYFTRTGKRYTGLDKEDKEFFERELKYDLHPDSDFWTDFKLTLEDKKPVITLNTEDTLHLFWYKFLKNHKDVANGYNDKKPGAKYILIEEKATAEEVMKVANLRIRALGEFSKLSIEQMRKCLRIYGHRAENASLEVIQSTLYQLVEENPSKFLLLWVNNENKEIQYIIEEAIARNIIRKNNSNHKYGSDILGYTLEDTIDYLKNPANNQVKLAILAQIEGSQSIDSNTTVDQKKSEFAKLKEEINKSTEE
jgi:hypothetical protein